MSHIYKTREIFTANSNALRRARRLYKFLCREALEGGDPIVTRAVASRMQAAKLYSINTPINDITFNLFRYTYRLYGDRLGMGWHQWMDDGKRWQAVRPSRYNT